MYVKDAANMWLLVPTSSGTPLYMEHYFPDKGKSACGKVSHPKTQPFAIYVQHGTCKTCQKHAHGQT